MNTSPENTALRVAKWIGVLIVGSAIAAVASAYLFTPVAGFFSHKHSLMSIVELRPTPYPNCTVFGLSVFPLEPIKSLNMLVHLDQPILQSVIQSGLDVNPNPTHSTSVKVDPPCEIGTKSSDRDESLTFNLSSDGRELIIKGHDLSRYDAQSFVGVIHQTSTSDPVNLDAMGDATYESFGHEFPATLHMVDPRTGADVMTQPPPPGFPR